MFYRIHFDNHDEFDSNEFTFFLPLLMLSILAGATIAFIIIYLF